MDRLVAVRKNRSSEFTMKLFNLSLLSDTIRELYLHPRPSPPPGSESRKILAVFISRVRTRTHMRTSYYRSLDTRGGGGEGCAV